MTDRITNLGPYDLLDWLLSCGSRDEIHAAIASWLQANPRAPTLAQQFARVDEMLAPWYAAGYDPRPLEPAVAELAAIVEGLGIDTGESTARGWLEDWLHEPHPALGGRCPIHLLASPEGVQQVRRLLRDTVSGAGPVERS